MERIQMQVICTRKIDLRFFPLFGKFQVRAILKDLGNLEIVLGSPSELKRCVGCRRLKRDHREIRDGGRWTMQESVEIPSEANCQGSDQHKGDHGGNGKANPMEP